MRCRKSKLVSPYVDGELSSGEKTLFETHARGCSECAGRLEAAQRTHDLFAHGEQYRSPYGFSARVMAKTTAPKKETFARVPLLVKFSEVVVVLVMMTVGIVSGRFLMSGTMNHKTGNIASSFSLEIFEPAPPGSLGGAYLALTEDRK